MNHRLTLLLSCAITICGPFICEPADAQHFKMPDNPIRHPDVPIAKIDESLPKSTTSFGAVVDGGWLYVIGGYTGPPHDYYLEEQCRDFYRVNLHDRSHVEYLPNEQRIQSCSLEAHDGRIIRIGGMVALNNKTEDQALDSLTNVMMFDTEFGEWMPLPSLPSRRSSHDSTTVGSRIVVAGGWGMDHESKTSIWNDDVIVLDMEDIDAGWKSIPAPFQRRALATTSIGDNVYVIGGLTSDRKMSKDLDILDLETETWSKGPEYPGTAFGVAAESVDGRIIASGSDGRIFAWAPGETEWSQVGTLTFPRFFHQMAVSSPEDVFFIGGISRGVRPVHIEHLDMAADPEENWVRHMAMPSPMNSKNRQAVFMHDGWIYLFGGNNSTGQHDFEAENFLAEGHRLSLAGMEWKPAADFPRQRQTIQSAMTPDAKSVFAIGGFGHDGEVARTWDEGFKYDMKNDSWSRDVPRLPVPRSQFGLVEHEGDLWVFGGLDYDSRRPEGDQFRHLTEVVSASHANGDEMFTHDGIHLTTPRRAFAAAKDGNRYYLVGGMKENFQGVDECEYFDFDSRTFVDIASPARSRLSAELVALDGKLYLAGGSSPKAEGGGFEANRSIEVYDPASNRWSMLMEEIPINPRHMRMMPYRGQLLIFSSHVDDADMVHLVFINPEMKTGISSESVAVQAAGRSETP